jgi:hypothetical protein
VPREVSDDDHGVVEHAIRRHPQPQTSSCRTASVREKVSRRSSPAAAQ